jgi:outer membrane receptor protein involved in Fe transport
VKKKSSVRLAIAASIVGFSVTSPQVILAASMLEEVIVTAQGREQNLSDVPVSVSVLSGETLNNFGVTSLQDVSERMPNVTIAAGPFDLINIRGVGSGNNGGFQQSVGTFVDGIYRSRSRGIHAALFDLERVEVLKGPQSTFFGANSVAGAISITTRKPGNEVDANASVLVGTDGEYNVELAGDLPVSDELSLRFAGRTNGMDGYLKTSQGDAPNRDAMQFRFSAAYNPSDTFSSDFRVDYSESETEGALAYQLVGCPVPDGFPSGTACSLALLNNNGVIEDKLDENSDTGLDFIDFEFFEIAWTNTFDIGASSQLIFKTGYYDHDSKARFTGIPFPNAPQAPLPPFLGGLPGVIDPFPLNLNEEYDQFSQEIRFQSDTGGKFDYMVGAYYSKADLYYENVPGFFFNDFGFLAANVVLPGFLANAPADVVAATQPLWSTHTIAPGDLFAGLLTNTAEDTTYSAFLAFTFRPMDDLTINLGGRYTEFEKKANRVSIFGRTDGNLSSFVPLNVADDFVLRLTLGGTPADFSPNTRTDSDFMPSLSVQYDFNDSVMGYASFSEGFKAGGFSAANDPGQFEPEFVDAYELGIKGSFMEGRLQANFTYFLNEYKDLQEASVVAQGVTLVSVVRNAAESESSGFEFDGGFIVNDMLSFTANVALLTSEYKNFPNAACNMRQAIEAGGSAEPCLQDLDGKKRAYSPEWSGNVSARLTLPVKSFELTIEPSVYFTDDLFLSAEADPWLAQEAYSKIDLRIALTPDDEKWSVAFIGKNLNDEITASAAAAVTNSDGSGRFIADRGRSFAIQLTMGL